MAPEINTTFIYLLSAILYLTGCTTVTETDITIDETKVIGYQFELEDKKSMEQPYVARFTKGDKQLLYVLSKHVSEVEYPKVVEDPTIVTIDQIFKSFKPQVVIVEGIPTGAKMSPRSMAKHAEICKSREFRRCGESFYAIDQAIMSDAEFVGGEPTEREIIEFVAKSGYSPKDLLAFYVVRQIPQMKRRSDFDPESFPAKCEKFMGRYRKRLGIKGVFGYPQFKEWYSKHMPEPKSFLDIENNDPAPHGGTSATYIQKISHQVGIARDRVILKRIESMLNQFDRVLIVYGGSHYLLQEGALKQALGKPNYFREVD